MSGIFQRKDGKQQPHGYEAGTPGLVFCLMSFIMDATCSASSLCLRRWHATP